MPSMYRLYACLTQEHAPGLLALSVLVCALASVTAFGLLERSRERSEASSLAWFLAAAVSVGTGIWSTHFIAMLAYDPGLPVGYEPVKTVLSLVIAVAISLLALLAARRPAAGAPAGGGLMIAGVAIMHYTGMEGVEVPGRVVWDPALAVASLALGLALAVLSLAVAHRRWSPRPNLLAGLVLALAICVFHFTTMAAATIVPDPAVPVAPLVISRDGLALGIAAAMLVVTTFAAAAALVDGRMASAAAETDRLRALANAAIEGIAIGREGRVVHVNESLAALLGRPAEALLGTAVADLIPGAGLPGAPPRETTLAGPGGVALPVEVHARALVYEGAPCTMLALRSLAERRLAEERIRHLASHDSLTGLKNRAGLRDAVTAAIARRGPDGRPVGFALHCLDLDRFKDVNDTYGHPMGDALLSVVAQRLQRLVRTGDEVFRLGGDEFVVLQAGADAAVADTLAERIVSRLGMPVRTGGRTLQVGASVGTVLHPENGLDPDTLLKHADIALYAAKDGGRNRSRRFDAAMSRAQAERHALEGDLLQAVQRGEMGIVYQPLVRAADGALYGYEALLRWTHPRLGPVAPDRFVPLAEECGAMPELGAWVLAQACRTAAGWPEPLVVCVNVSAVQVGQVDLARTVAEALAATGLPPARLELEVTETALMRDRARVRGVLDALKAQGVGLALDDFGTGYSSLAYLRDFPFDALKIDRSFVADLDRRGEALALVRGIVDLAHGLGLRVVAEGVESRVQADILRELGCDVAQGHLFGRPSATPARAVKPVPDPPVASSDQRPRPALLH